MIGRLLAVAGVCLLVPALAAGAGGETIETATLIPALPFTDSDNTCGHQSDSDEACPYPDSVSPDLLYAYTPDLDMIVDIDLCESGYDARDIERSPRLGECALTPPCGP
jgi:hypothetical protein